MDLPRVWGAVGRHAIPISDPAWSWVEKIRVRSEVTGAGGEVFGQPLGENWGHAFRSMILHHRVIRVQGLQMRG